MTPDAPLTVFAQDALTDLRALRAAMPIMRREGHRRAARQMGHAIRRLEHLVRAEAGCTTENCMVVTNTVYHHTSCRRSWEYQA